MNKTRTITALATILASAAIAAAPGTAQAQFGFAAPSTGNITLGAPGFNGTGCPTGSVTAIVSPDGRQLSVLYSGFVAEVGGATGRSIDRKSCNLAIPVHVPNGISISILKIDYRGFNYLPSGGRSQFQVEYFFAGQRGPLYTRTFYGPLVQDYFIENTLLATAVVWSACGEDVNLRTNTSLTLTTVGNREALSTVDTQDVRGELVYHIQTRRC